MRLEFSAINRVALIAAVVLSGAVAFAQTSAAELVARGDYAEAAAAFERAAREEGAEDRAADSLYSAARIYEERLQRPERALAIYREIEEHYPRARVALSAARRRSILAPLIERESDSLAHRQWQALLENANTLPLGDIERRVSEIVAQAPDWPGRGKALLWLGSRQHDADELERARQTLRRARELTREGSSTHFDATLRLADIESSQGHYETAMELAGPLQQASERDQRQVADAMVERIEKRRLRGHLAEISYTALIACLLFLIASLYRAAPSPASALRTLGRPPIAVIFACPVWLLFVAMAAASYAGIRNAVMIIAVAGIAVAWLSGAALSVGKAGRGRLVTHVVATVVATASACYIAVHRHGLLDQILATVRFGPDT